MNEVILVLRRRRFLRLLRSSAGPSRRCTLLARYRAAHPEDPIGPSTAHAILIRLSSLRLASVAAGYRWVAVRESSEAF